MATCVRVHFEVIPILSKICQRKNVFGYLLGYRVDETFEVVSCIACDQSQEDGIGPLQFVAGGVDLLGMFYSGAQKLNTGCISSDIKDFQILQEQRGNSFVICAVTNKCKSVTDDNFFLMSEGSAITKQAVTITNDDILANNKLLVRVKCNIPITFDLGTKGSWRVSLSKEIEDICKVTQTEQAIFHLQDSSVVLSTCRTCGAASDADSVELYDKISKDEDNSRKKKSKTHILDPLQFSMYYKISGKSCNKSVPTCSPVITHHIGNSQSVEMTLGVDVITIISRCLPVGDLADILSSVVSNQLATMSECIVCQTKDDKFSVPVPYHFQPMGMQMIFTAVYLQDRSDEEIVTRRQFLHEILGLTPDRPLFRRSNAIMFSEERAKGGYLFNPHIGLSSSGLRDGKEYLVHGLYTYHHYMQDRFDDNKWGCAYRSLQTLISWFRLQGYTDVPIPSHRQIQQALVDCGDKGTKFVGSRQWIGSLEVSYVLDQLLSVASKIMFVSSGADLASKGRELAMHFQNQGTPIMIGGGVLAHTILGVDFSDVTGEVKFLILDPHYTGAEDLKVIQDKGWCGWKGTNFWDQMAHYNLCMPQRPLVI